MNYKIVWNIVNFYYNIKNLFNNLHKWKKDLVL